jgi:hypothetical protein
MAKTCARIHCFGKSFFAEKMHFIEKRQMFAHFLFPGGMLYYRLLALHLMTLSLN